MVFKTENVQNGNLNEEYGTNPHEFTVLINIVDKLKTKLFINIWPTDPHSNTNLTCSQH